MRSRLGQQYSSLYSYPLPTQRRRNYWPILLSIVLIGLCLLLVWWVLGGQASLRLFESSDAPTVSDRVVALDLAGQQFFIPENYLRSSSQRAGGSVDRIDLYALWPSMRGFNEGDADAFGDKSETSRVIYLTLTAPTQVWRPAERFYQVYPYYFAGPEESASYGLMRRRMDDGSGLGDHDVYYYQNANEFFLFHCLRDKSELIPSDCVADKIIEPKILARYRFRRAMLVDWRELDEAVEALLSRFVGR